MSTTTLLRLISMGKQQQNQRNDKIVRFQSGSIRSFGRCMCAVWPREDGSLAFNFQSDNFMIFLPLFPFYMHNQRRCCCFLPCHSAFQATQPLGICIPRTTAKYIGARNECAYWRATYTQAYVAATYVVLRTPISWECPTVCPSTEETNKNRHTSNIENVCLIPWVAILRVSISMLAQRVREWNGFLLKVADGKKLGYGKISEQVLM